MRTKGSRPGDGELVVQMEAELWGHGQRPQQDRNMVGLSFSGVLRFAADTALDSRFEMNNDIHAHICT